MDRSSRVFVAGGRGMVGSAIVRRLRAEGIDGILAPTRSELDLRSQAAVDAWMAEMRPTHVFLAAAKVGSGIKKHGKSHIGHKLSANADAKYKLLRKIWAGTASEHDSQHFEAVIDGGNTSSVVYADRCYASAEREAALKARALLSRQVSVMPRLRFHAATLQKSGCRTCKLTLGRRGRVPPLAKSMLIVGRRKASA
jgi:IS5 family transposase